MNGTATPPSTPGSKAPEQLMSNGKAPPSRPSTLKKRRPSGGVSVSSPGVNTSAGPGPSPLRRELSTSSSTSSKTTREERHSQRDQERRLARQSQLFKRLIKYEIPRKGLHTSIGFLALYLYMTHQDTYVLVRALTYTLAIVLSADVLRFMSRRIERRYESLLGFLMRESEKTTWNGVIWYLVGVIFVLTTLPRDIAVLSVVLLSWADTSASVFGRKFGKYTPKLPSPPFADRKSLAGTLSAFCVGYVSAYLFYVYAAPSGSEGDLSWVGPGAVARYTPAFLSDWHRKVHAGPSTGFPDWLDVGGGRKITTRLPQPRSTLPMWQLQLITAIAASLAEGIDVYGLDDNVILPVASGLLIWAALYLLG